MIAGAGWFRSIPLPNLTQALNHIADLQAQDYITRPPAQTSTGWVVKYRPLSLINQSEEEEQMQKQAIDKLKKEMNAEKPHSYIRVIGDMLIRTVESNPQVAEKILAADKTIAKALQAVKDEAKKLNKGEREGGISYESGFEVVLKYFGIEGMTVTVTTVVAPASKTGTENSLVGHTSSSSSFDVDDLLQGL